MFKMGLYAVMTLISMWVLESIRIDNVFKKGRELQIKALFIMLSFALSYLVTNFIYDFCFTIPVR